MRTPNFQEFVRRAGGLSDETMRELTPLIRMRRVPRGEAFVRSGDRTEELGFVEEGLFKLHGKDSHGKPFVVEFTTPGEIVSDYSAMVLNIPARLTIEALEDSLVSVLAFADYQALIKAHAGLHEVARNLLEALVVKLSDREYQFLTMGAKERYLEFAARRQDILGRVTRNDVAAYLGISPESLSRLKAQILRERRDQRL